MSNYASVHRGIAEALVVHFDGNAIRLNEKVAFLSSVSSYPEGTSGVEAVETHMAWVFLTDRYAYKLKKPVRSPLLDFSTPEKRRFDSEEEVRLNRRLAPGVYLGVLPLVAMADGMLALGTPADEREVVDWLVHMRRLPAGEMLDARVQNGTLEEDDVRRLARTLARFYRGAEPVGVAPGDYLRRCQIEVDTNRRALSKEKYGLPHALVERAFAGQHSLLEREGELIEGRASHVVEAHGDLRPEHVYLTHPEPLIIDCLEFNRELRLRDPVEELAFLSMECARLGAPEVEDILFNEYAAVTGDRPPGRLIRFYQAYAACIRAKLSIWHLDDHEPRAAETWVPRAEAYLRIARRALT